MMTTSDITIGYDLNSWINLGVKTPVNINVSPRENSHILITGMSGSGKSYAMLQIMARLYLAQPGSSIVLADYKKEISLEFLNNSENYYPYKDSMEALDRVYNELQERQQQGARGLKNTTLIWDEYVANMLALTSENKKIAQRAMNHISEILMLGRTLGIRLIVSCQRPDAMVFPAGSRLNFGIIIILGKASRSTYEMLMPDYVEEVKHVKFNQGEGALILQGADLHFIKIPTVKNMVRLQELCKRAIG